LGSNLFVEHLLKDERKIRFGVWPWVVSKTICLPSSQELVMGSQRNKKSEWEENNIIYGI
jgi:hypothetical protein